MTRNNSEVKTYVEINRVCIRDGNMPLLRAWYWLRHNDMEGTGSVKKEEFFQRVRELGLTRKRAKQILSKGEGLFWSVEGDYVNLIGQKPLISRLNLEGNEGSWVLIPVNAMFKLETFIAYAYASWFTKKTYKEFLFLEDEVLPSGGTTISRARIQELFGISFQTQRCYEKISGMQVQEQVVYFDPKAGDLENIPLTEKELNGGNGGVWLQDVDNDGRLEIVRQIPNQYASKLTVAKQRKCIKKTGTAPLAHGGDPKQYQRMYFDSYSAAEKAKSRGKTPNGVAYVRQPCSIERKRGVFARLYKAIY